MAAENLDLVRSIFADWERGDYGSADWAGSEVEYVQVDGRTPGRWSGLVGMAEGWRGWLSAWEEFRVEAEEYLELDDARVLALCDRIGRGKMSGMNAGLLRSRGATLFHIREGTVTGLIVYSNIDRALADLGPEE